MIRAVTLGFAGCDADHKVREEGGNNRGPRIRQYLDGLDPPIHADAPWCGAFVQYCSDAAARLLGVPNPLDAIRHEALVQSYVDSLRSIASYEAEPGDLVAFRFESGPDRWNHIGILAQKVETDGTFFSVEGNTSDESQRDGDAVAVKPRSINDSYDVRFLTWGDGERVE